ncbi:MarR family winged helix-turn-helix transcriptional regulator [uncultured Methylobacterium sp.]|uniref:MarR family winged helix-turn-helix transcriptional regulator n=1 Tax=uncultured Methylobacterium sp. TaxID=157278 RepID=UPI0035CC2582
MPRSRPAEPSPATVDRLADRLAVPLAVPLADPSADPLRVWFRFIRLNRRVTAAMGVELRAIGLSIPQFDVLSTLTEREGLTQRDLAARLYVTKGNVSGLIDRLVEAGLVERRAIPGDRRSHALHLTGAGSELALRGLAAQAAYVGRTLGRLGAADLADFEALVLRWRALARHDSARHDPESPTQGA